MSDTERVSIVVEGLEKLAQVRNAVGLREGVSVWYLTAPLVQKTITPSREPLLEIIAQTPAC